jgi:hypothetical protein
MHIFVRAGWGNGNSARNGFMLEEGSGRELENLL